MQLLDLQTRLLARVGEIPGAVAGNQFYTTAEATTALNTAQRLFVLRSLCLEVTETEAILTANTPFYSLLNTFPDWIVPLRIRLTATQSKLTPSRLDDFAAVDASWSLTVGTPKRYAILGFDFFATYPVASAPISLDVTYARCPSIMASPTDTPEIPEEYHQDLIDGAIPLLRAKEGGEEFKKTMPNWKRFLDAGDKLAGYVRARNKSKGYDYLPMELQRFNMSKLSGVKSGVQ